MYVSTRTTQISDRSCQTLLLSLHSILISLWFFVLKTPGTSSNLSGTVIRLTLLLGDPKTCLPIVLDQRDFSQTTSSSVRLHFQSSGQVFRKRIDPLFTVISQLLFGNLKTGRTTVSCPRGLSNLYTIPSFSLPRTQKLDSMFCLL